MTLSLLNTYLFIQRQGPISACPVLCSPNLLEPSSLNHSSITNSTEAFLYPRPENNLLFLLILPPLHPSWDQVTAQSAQKKHLPCLPLKLKKQHPLESQRPPWRPNVEAIFHQFSLDLSSNPPSPKPQMRGQYGCSVFSRTQWRELLTCKKGVPMPPVYQQVLPSSSHIPPALSQKPVFGFLWPLD